MSRSFNSYRFSLVFGLAVVLTGANVVHAQIEVAVQSFDQGNELYRTGSYQEAVEAYNQAIDGGYTSGALLYNLGNAYFRLDELGQAIRYYEKARLLLPENLELSHNLEIAQRKAVDQFSRLPAPVWVTWWQNMVARNGGRWLFWGGLLFYVLAVAVAIYRMRTSSRDPWIRRVRAICILVGLVLLIGAFAASMQSVSSQRAVILDDRVELKEEADLASFSDLAIHEGLIVDILQRSEGWLEVRLPNGARGWVPTGSVGEI